MIRAFLLGALGLSATLAGPIGCMFPAAKPYEPLTKQEAQLLSRARRDFLPEDARYFFAKQIEGRSNAELVAWAGILREKRSSNGTPRFVVEHRYWDWINDYGTQSTRIFLSARGEGLFHFALAGDEGQWLMKQAEEGQMLIVYGVPIGVDPDGAIDLRYVHARGIPQSMYATDVWDYGRGSTALKILRLDAF